MCYSMRRNKESDIEKERKAPDNSFWNNCRKAHANPDHTNAYPASADQRPSGLLFWKQKSKSQYEISGVSQRYQLLNFIWDASTASGKNGGMTYDVTEHCWRKLI